MQNLGGKLITDNGDPFTASSDLPSTTPYGGVVIADKDYAYIQNTGTAERWSATVSGSSVTWVQEYAISIPVFTPTQQAAIDSTVTATKIGNYDAHIDNTTIHVTATDKSTWNGKQNALPTSGTPSDTFAINVSGNAATANNLPFGKIARRSPDSGYRRILGIKAPITNGNNFVAADIYESLFEGNDIFKGKLIVSVRRTYNSDYIYKAYYKGTPLEFSTLYVKYDTSSHTAFVFSNKENNLSFGIKAVVTSAQNWRAENEISDVICYEDYEDEDISQYTNVSITTNYICMVSSQVGSTRLPIFANYDGTLSPMNIDEYYCWAQPTPQWTDVMEMAVWYVQNQCNNEILGSTRNINLNTTHPSLCYLHVKLPTLEGAGRYRFTLEFEITNSSGQNSTEAYGVLILDPPTGYSGESFLAECVYDSNGKAQSSVMNQIHIPPQGSTYRHKLYVDGHTYRVVKTK